MHGSRSYSKSRSVRCAGETRPGVQSTVGSVAIYKWFPFLGVDSVEKKEPTQKKRGGGNPDSSDAAQFNGPGGWNFRGVNSTFAPPPLHRRHPAGDLRVPHLVCERCVPPPLLLLIGQIQDPRTGGDAEQKGPSEWLNTCTHRQVSLTAHYGRKRVIRSCIFWYSE